MTETQLLQVIEQAAIEAVTELDLSGNQLTALPPEIGKLTQLKKLIVGKYRYWEINSTTRFSPPRFMDSCGLQ